ncbi:MAG TPA: ATP-binding protein [Vicinamibacterales bacterium]
MARVLMLGRNQDLFDELRRRASLDEQDVCFSTEVVEELPELRQQSWDVVVTNLGTTPSESLALIEQTSRLHPSVRVITLFPAATNQEIIDAIRARVFACFVAPFDPGAIADMIQTALRATDWRDGIEVISGLPHWLTLRVASHLLTADRVIGFVSEMQKGMPDDERDLLLAAFRELLLNAMEHGAGFDAEKIIEVTAAKTARAIVFHFRDPGLGFDADDLRHAAASESPDEVLASAFERANRGLRPGGFGMLIARQIADELVYNERRNEVLMIKHLE